MSQQVKAVPEGFHTLTPHLIVRGAADAIEFYKKAFGAEEICRMAGPDGATLVHAEIKIGDSFVMLCDECPDMGARSPQALNGTPVTLSLYVEDCDLVFNQAVAAGATVRMPPADMFWGDRYSKITDPFGHEWSIGTHKEELTAEEIHARSQAFFAQAASSQ